MQVMGRPLLCEVCNKNEAAGVASSVFGAISHAYCHDCVLSEREVWSTMLGGLCGVQRGDVADWAKPIISATCAFYGKTEDEFWAELAKLEEEYMAAEAKREAQDGHGLDLGFDSDEVAPPIVEPNSEGRE